MTTKDKDMSEQSIKAESQKHILAAMANSFKEGHLVDVLDIECLRIAAEEITYLEKKVEKAQDINIALLARIAELEAKLEAVEKDAGRYRRVRVSNGDYVGYMGGGCYGLLELDELDAAIDRDIDAAKQEATNEH